MKVTSLSALSFFRVKQTLNGSPDKSRVLKKFNGFKLEANLLNDENLKTIKPFQNVVLENLNLDVNENLVYTLFNIIDQDNKFLIITSLKPIAEINFKLKDFKSRTRNCLLAKIENPDDELMFALILKNLSDRQITLDKKLIQEYRKADEQYTFDPKKHMNLSKSDI